MTPALAQAAQEGRDELTAEEMEQFADEQARTYLGVSLDDFRRRAAADSLPKDDPMIVHIALLTGVELHTC